jgi:dipeptidyl aminopeptidase/acylaminoacyl peptidase
MRVVSRIRDGLTPSFRPVWGVNDSTIFVARYEGGTARLYALSVSTGQWTAMTPDSLSVTLYAFSRDRSALVAVLENVNQPAELYRVSLTGGPLERLTSEARQLSNIQLGHVEQLEWSSDDGRFKIHGFLVKPPGYDPAVRYPLIVQVHGGPGAFYPNAFIDVNFAPQYIPPQLLAAAGYLVLLPNPRGDPSYGEDFHAALRFDMAVGPLGDIQAGVNSLTERGLVDSTRLGIAGVSYGGYLTTYAITHTASYKAASVNDAPIDLASEYAQNYATRALIQRWYLGGSPWGESQRYTEQSPITYIANARTPILMRYGGKSVTADGIRQSYMLAQGFELYAGLRDQNVPVQFVLHPYESHGIHDWLLYRDWVKRNLRWFDYWVRHQGDNPLTGLIDAEVRGR